MEEVTGSRGGAGLQTQAPMLPRTRGQSPAEALSPDKPHATVTLSGLPFPAPLRLERLHVFLPRSPPSFQMKKRNQR